jgi:hypothetical protein
MPDTDIERTVAQHFASNVAGHRMFVRLDQGLYRHLVFEQRKHSWNDRFEIITAPGSLTITGDRGAHTFRRIADMFQFFRMRSTPYGINASYWAEKLPDSGRSVKVYSQYAMEQHLRQELRDLAEDYQRELLEWRNEDAQYGEEAGDKPKMPKVLRQARQLVFDALVDGDLMYSETAHVLVEDLRRVGVAEDAWEWDLTDWDFHFLHNLHAIAWGIQQYDRAVKSGLHVARTGPTAWDAPIPTVAPLPPAPPAPKKPARAGAQAAVTVGGVL